MTGYKCCTCKRTKRLRSDVIIAWRNRDGTPKHRCNSCNTDRMKRYRSTPNGRAKINAAVARSTRKHQNKQDARILLNTALASGRVRKPAHCRKCTVRKVEAHHPDYTKPLAVEWYCRKHHAIIHPRGRRQPKKIAA